MPGLWSTTATIRWLAFPSRKSLRVVAASIVPSQSGHHTLARLTLPSEGSKSMASPSTISKSTRLSARLGSILRATFLLAFLASHVWRIKGISAWHEGFWQGRVRAQRYPTGIEPSSSWG